MKKNIVLKRTLSIITAASMFLSSNIGGSVAFAEATGDYKFDNPGEGTTLSEITDKYGEDLSGKTIIVSTNDIHGAIQDYAYIAAMKQYFISKNATVFLVDSGDFSSDKFEKDKVYVNYDKKKVGYLSSKNGWEAVRLMQAAGYDYATWGNHEFSNKNEIFDKFLDEFNKAEKKGGPKLLNANILKDGKNAFTPHAIEEVSTNGDTLRIGFFGIDTEEAQNTSSGKNYNFRTGKDLFECAREEVKYLKGLDGGENKDKPVDIVVCLSHIGLEISKEGNRSADIWKEVTIPASAGSNKEIPGIDLMLDGHSHTAINGGTEDHAPILSTGIWGKYVGVTVIDNHSKKIDGTYLIHEDNYWKLKIENTGNATIEEVNAVLDDITNKYNQTIPKNAVDKYKEQENNANKNSDKNTDKKSGKNNKSKRSIDEEEAVTESSSEKSTEIVSDTAATTASSDADEAITASSEKSEEDNVDAATSASSEEKNSKEKSSKEKKSGKHHHSTDNNKKYGKAG